MIQLDNEPDLWSSTHPEVHPTAVTYAELAQRDAAYAKAIKAVWPSVKVVGPVNYGWEGFTNLQNASDAAADGNFVDWYLGQMKADSTAAGERLVDDLDVHWYPEATGGGNRITNDASGDSAAEVAAREQAPRSLWDPSYVESSWITNDVLHGPIDLLPGLQAKIANDYPGTGLSISEWDYGGGNEISGAIADADVLGIFGQQGVTDAAYWPLFGNETFSNAAFEAFRNYDGNGGSFGDTSIQAISSDPSTASVYASMNAANHHQLVFIAINKAHHGQDGGHRPDRRGGLLLGQGVHDHQRPGRPRGRRHHRHQGAERLPVHDAGPVDLHPGPQRRGSARLSRTRPVRAWTRAGRGSRGRPGTSRDLASGSTSCRTTP